MNTKDPHGKQKLFLIVMLGVLNTLTPISIDMYLPGFPQVARDLGTSMGNVALSASTYFLGFAIGQIVYGPLLDRFGRKVPLYIGLFLYAIASVGCIYSHSIEIFWIMRFFQALCGCVASVTAMAMVGDFFSTEQSARVISFLILILGVSPLLAPTVGGFIVNFWGWHWVFIVLATISLIILVCVYLLLPEGHDPDPSISLKAKSIIAGFKAILFERQFYVFALAGSFAFAGLFVYVAGSPSIFMQGFHLSPKTYGGIFALLSVSFIGGSQMNHLLTRKFKNVEIFKTTLYIQVLVSILFLIGELEAWNGLIAVIIFLFILLGCAGLTYPNAAALALSPFSKNGGSASALLGFIQIGIGGLISSSVGVLGFKGNLSTAFAMSLSAVIGLILLLSQMKKLSDNYKGLLVA
jgi:MFS transporter, DHA1 family, multidrug resistance protein